MNAALIDKIAEAVLYEGYILYPYRPSTKNRQRWTFGGVYPRAWCDFAQSGDRWQVSSEGLIIGSNVARIHARLRCLQVMSREVRHEPDGPTLASLEIDGQSWHTWQEATEREVTIGPVGLTDLARGSLHQTLNFGSSETTEILCDTEGNPAGALIRRQAAIAGSIELAATPLGDDLWRVAVRATNDTPCDDPAGWSRDEAALHALASTHVVLGADQGSFVSLADPPAPLRAAAAECRQEGLWPVLVGEASETDALLAAPIILYDYPQIAPESAGDLFDGTEIDEILSLRILTLSDDEKQAVRAVDARARALLERTEALDADRLSALHGRVRELRHVQEPNNASLR